MTMMGSIVVAQLMKSCGTAIYLGIQHDNITRVAQQSNRC
jgi:hypothetical protein